MKYINRTVLFFLIAKWCSFPLQADYPARFEGSFEGWDKKRFDLIALFLPSNPTIVQAGSYYGEETLLLASIWPQGEIFAFEPNPHAFAKLSIATRKHPHIHPVNLALNHTPGWFPLYVCYGSSGSDVYFEFASSLLPPSDSMKIHLKGPKKDVKAVVLDNWCQDNDVQKIDLLCLDVRGTELSVLQSSPEILNTISCIYLHTELFPFRIGTTHFSDLREFLEKSGFRLLSHWYAKGLEGHALFVKNSFFTNRNTENYLKTHKVRSDTYQRYHEGYFNLDYDLDYELNCDGNPNSLKECIKQGYPFESEIVEIMIQCATPGSVVIDIGSHIGTHALPVARKVGPSGAVIAFEPMNKWYMELLHHISLNECTNIIPIAKALGNAPQQIPKEMFFGSRLDNNDFPLSKTQTEDVVDIITLDSLNLNCVSLMKIDVENYEYFTFQGGKETILRNKPVILFECWVKANYQETPLYEKENFDRVISLIKSFGYEIYSIYSNDFIAFPIDKDHQMNAYKNRFRKLDLDHFNIGL